MPDTGIDIKDVVKEKYGQAALRVTNKTGSSSCCGASPAGGLSCDPITSNLYDAADAGQLDRAEKIVQGVILVSAVAQTDFLAALGNHAHGRFRHPVNRLEGHR